MTTPEPDPTSAPDGYTNTQIDVLTAKLSALAAGFDLQAEQLASMTTALPPEDDDDPDAPGGAEPLFILAFDDPQYEQELELMTPWVDEIWTKIYGPETTAGRPWCPRWKEHPEAVARLHALWLAWQAALDPESGAAGPSSWQRDHLEPALMKLRSADGPFGACTSSGGHISHRVLPHPVLTDTTPVDRPLT
ncbi:DUF4913 domain-containing protein [Kitasatospora griseola]|uniref:DUF4913 domain-containing protein n=1 Tax=Kitasatospora griseola TaxID=2064 RepID=UPI00166FE5AC|nr:DUF4913 domain-containing protein [Kitasatospora griseola]GGR03477.1 DUF4913 domain-containing protein [Kitasatospora griseola]